MTVFFDLFRSHFLVRRSCRAHLGWHFKFGPAKFGKIAGEFLGEFWWQIFFCKFSALFLGPRKKFTPKVHAQKFIGIPLSNFTFSNPTLFLADFLLTGETNISLQTIFQGKVWRVRRGCQASQRKGWLPGKSGKPPGKSGKLPGNPWIAVKFHSERTSGEVAEKLPGKFGELPEKSGDFPEARGSLTPSQRLAKSVSKYYGDKPRERNSGEFFRRHGRKMRRKNGEIFRRFSSFNFQEKWAQEISRKIGDKFGWPWNKILSPRDSGSLGAVSKYSCASCPTLGWSYESRSAGEGTWRAPVSWTSAAALVTMPSSWLCTASTYAQQHSEILGVADPKKLSRLKGAQTMKCKLWTETLEFWRWKVPNSRFALHGWAPP